jgi:hypothetical protein
MSDRSHPPRRVFAAGASGLVRVRLVALLGAQAAPDGRPGNRFAWDWRAQPA